MHLKSVSQQALSKASDHPFRGLKALFGCKKSPLEVLEWRAYEGQA